MIWLLQNGGYIIYVLLFFSIGAVTVGIIKFSQLRRAVIEQKEFLQQFQELLGENQIKGAFRHCREGPKPIGDIFLAGLKKIGTSRDEISEVIEDRATIDMKQYEKGLGVLATIAHISPLLGLLGTVIGMIQAFISVQEATGSGMAVQAADLSQGIWQALLTTAAGLTVAIIAYLMHSYLVSLRDKLFEQLETYSFDIVNQLNRFRRSNDSEG